MGRYEVCDFVLLLNTYAISGYKSLKEFFQDLKPVADILMSVWRREQCPVASSLSRFLADVDPQAVESLRQIFQANTNQNAIKFSTGLGISDRTGDRYAVFDIDGTVCAVRRRDLSDPKDYLIGQRRSSSAAAPGYRGRKRGEAVRTRTTISHAQTGEWLGTYGASGNGEVQQSGGAIALLQFLTI